jgi:tetraacyldisaccharide 4'-kinase
MADGSHPLRQALWPLGLLYGAVAALRNWTFDAKPARGAQAAVPVVSIGNLTVGGTGKTPTVAWLCSSRTPRPAARGARARLRARARGALNDEGEMLQRRLPWLLQEQDPDRVAAGQRLVQDGADYVVLDDGLQHRRLHRDLDVVCLDAHLPFGNGTACRPGTCASSVRGCARADMVLLTRASGLDEERSCARGSNGSASSPASDLPVHACRARAGVAAGDAERRGVAARALRGRPVVLLSAIARPQSFSRHGRRSGRRCVREFRHRDHHRFTEAELNRRRRRGAKCRGAAAADREGRRAAVGVSGAAPRAAHRPAVPRRCPAACRGPAVMVRCRDCG